MKDFGKKIETEFNEQVENYKKKDTSGRILIGVLIAIGVFVGLFAVIGILQLVIALLGTVLIAILVDIGVIYLLFTGFWYGKFKGIPRRLLFYIFISAWFIGALGNGWNFWAIVPFLNTWYFWGRLLSIPTGSDKKG